MPINGLVVMTPTSIASTGTGNSSSIGANGKVTFSSCVTLSLNGVFTSTYDNYAVSIRFNASGGTTVQMRFRASGTDATGVNYTHQELQANNTTVSGSRTSDISGWTPIFGSNVTQRCGSTVYFFGPFLVQPTAFRAVSVNDFSSARIFEYAGTHSLSTAYDGFTLLPFGGPSITGAITVYGFNQ